MFREWPPLLSPRVEREVPDPPAGCNFGTTKQTGPGRRVCFRPWYFPSRPSGKGLPCLVNGSPGRGARDSRAEMRRPRPVHSSHRGVARRLAPGVLRRHGAAGPPARVKSTRPAWLETAPFTAMAVNALTPQLKEWQESPFAGPLAETHTSDIPATHHSCTLRAV